TMLVAAEVVAMTRAALRTHPASTSAYLQRERTRLGEQLHDDLLQSVTSAVIELEALTQTDGIPAGGKQAVATTREALGRSVADIREVVAALSEGRSPTESAQTAESLPTYIENVIEQWGLSTRVVVEGDLQRIPPIAAMLAGAVIRESLVNVAKH